MHESCHRSKGMRRKSRVDRLEPHRTDQRRHERNEQKRNALKRLSSCTDETLNRLVSIKARRRTSPLTLPLPSSCLSAAAPLNRPFRARGAENNQPSLVLGIFGLSGTTTEANLHEIFGGYGAVERINIIYDKQTGLSRGFGFIYMAEQEAATKAKEAMNGTDLHGRQIRVDYSLTSKPHDSTPGQYMGRREGFGRGGPGGPGGPPPPPMGGPEGFRGGWRPPPSGYIPKDMRGPPNDRDYRRRSRSRSPPRRRSPSPRPRSRSRSPPRGRDLDEPRGPPPEERA